MRGRRLHDPEIGQRCSPLEHLIGQHKVQAALPMRDILTILRPTRFKPPIEGWKHQLVKSRAGNTRTNRV